MALIWARVAAKLEATRKFAAEIGLLAQLEEKLRYLDQYASPRTTRCTLYHDFAPHSFGFTMEARGKDGEWRVLFEGGLIFHGSHDGHGSGAYPALAVTVSPTSGWSIHT